MNRSGSSYNNSSYSTISVFNNTSYTLTLRYSGPESKRFDIKSKGRINVTLLNGNYKVTASVNASNVTNYAGTEYINGEYDSEFYIVTSYY